MFLMHPLAPSGFFLGLVSLRVRKLWNVQRLSAHKFPSPLSKHQSQEIPRRKNDSLPTGLKLAGIIRIVTKVCIMWWQRSACYPMINLLLWDYKSVVGCHYVLSQLPPLLIFLPCLLIELRHFKAICFITFFCKLHIQWYITWWYYFYKLQVL